MTTPQEAHGQGDDRPLAEDMALPVNVVPNANWAQPEGWDWHATSTSQPNAATFHISHSDVTRVFTDVLTPADSPRDAYFVLKKKHPSGHNRQPGSILGRRVQDRTALERAAGPDCGGHGGGGKKHVGGGTWRRSCGSW